MSLGEPKAKASSWDLPKETGKPMGYSGKLNENVESVQSSSEKDKHYGGNY